MRSDQVLRMLFLCDSSVLIVSTVSMGQNWPGPDMTRLSNVSMRLNRRTERTGICLRRVFMACSKIALLDLNSESDSDDEQGVRYVVLLLRKGMWLSPYFTQRETFGEYQTLVKDLPEEQFTNYFRLSRKQTNWRIPICTKDKLAVCLSGWCRDILQPSDGLKLFFDAMYLATKELAPGLHKVMKRKLFSAVSNADDAMEDLRNCTPH
ncbi:hypothetical protein PR048_033724 [Dryococelus australis]|uniref:Uncharacterized protein n=1 Tax=Dryococelus australis TaxID=614101 RepID=A0ABQ9G126_9NEOP|nr:hypothetical protein PR048_033724 [Dryococelus australis]